MEFRKDIILNNESVSGDGNQIVGFIPEKLSTDPINLYQGRIWYNTTENIVKYYDGTTVLPLGAGTDLSNCERFDNNDYWYFSCNTLSGDWQVNRYSKIDNSKSQSTGTGTKPNNLITIESLTYS